KGARDDIRVAGDNLYKTLLDRGYQFVDSKNGMLSLSSGKAWGLFANGFMQADINRQYMGTTQPSIAEMTAKAIELLSKDKDGFFLVVEGSQVDWGDHYNDVAWSVGDFLAFDNAVGVALDFAQKDGKTLVMAFPDHNTGGLTIGNYYEATNKIGHEYTATTLEDVANPLKGMKITAAALTAILTGVTDNTAIKAIFKEWWNLDITDADISAMKTGSTINNFTKIGEYIDKTYTVFGWTTAGHTGDDVPLWAYGPMHNTPVGHYDNTDFAKIIAEILDFKLIETQNKLFVKVSDVFKSSEWAIDLTDSKNPILEINYGGVAATLPASKDILKLRLNGESTTYILEGLVIYCPDIMNVFIPIEAINLIISAG
ncbi:MAG TPA: alkaline phosphatase, partial [Candidatus Bathyarchaeia archaeon]